MDRLQQMEQHMHHTFHNVNQQFKDMQQRHDSDLAVLTDSLVQVGQRVDSLAADVTHQIQHLTTMVQALMTHNGAPLPPSQPLSPHTTTHTEPTGFVFGSRQLHRNGTGSRSPRRDAEDENPSHNNAHCTDDDGIPQLAADFTFDSR